MEITSKELYEKLTPVSTIQYFAQLLSDGLSVNMSDAYSQLIREAARCNDYCSDVVSDIRYIEHRLSLFREGEEFEPVWIGFRRHGVDGTMYLLSRLSESENIYEPLYHNYFVVYSVTVKKSEPGFYHVVFSKYNT